MNNKSKIKFFNGKSADAELSRKLLNAASHAALDIKKAVQKFINPTLQLPSITLSATPESS